MAKEISVLQALEVLQSAGIALGEDNAAAIKELTTAAYMSKAVEIIGGNGENLPGKLIAKPASEADVWATHLFDLAEEFANDFAGEVKNVQGGATRMVRVVGIDTPAGHFKLELRSE